MVVAFDHLIGGGMMDDHGNFVDLEHHGLAMGGQWATESMMTGGMGSGMMGGRHPGSHVGDGWQRGGHLNRTGDERSFTGVSPCVHR